MPTTLCPIDNSVVCHRTSQGFLICFKNGAPISTHTLSLHDALPISRNQSNGSVAALALNHAPAPAARFGSRDRKSTRLNSSHLGISYAGFCLKKKNKHPSLLRQNGDHQIMRQALNNIN